MGASGVGKTTLFRLLLGLQKPDHGTVFGIEGQRVSAVFQEDRLFPQLTVLQNVCIGSQKNRPIAEATGRFWLEQLGLGAEADAMPDTLSGGMCRRVALARAICYDGEVFLLDEPLKGLDEQTKAQVISLLRPIGESRPLLLITHDRQEAQALADDLMLLQADGSWQIQNNLHNAGKMVHP